MPHYQGHVQHPQQAQQAPSQHGRVPSSHGPPSQHNASSSVHPLQGGSISSPRDSPGYRPHQGGGVKVHYGQHNIRKLQHGEMQGSTRYRESAHPATPSDVRYKEYYRHPGLSASPPAAVSRSVTDVDEEIAGANGAAAAAIAREEHYVYRYAGGYLPKGQMGSQAHRYRYEHEAARRASPSYKAINEDPTSNDYSSNHPESEKAGPSSNHTSSPAPTPRSPPDSAIAGTLPDETKPTTASTASSSSSSPTTRNDSEASEAKTTEEAQNDGPRGRSSLTLPKPTALFSPSPTDGAKSADRTLRRTKTWPPPDYHEELQRPTRKEDLITTTQESQNAHRVRNRSPTRDYRYEDQDQDKSFRTLENRRECFVSDRAGGSVEEQKDPEASLPPPPPPPPPPPTGSPSYGTLSNGPSKGTHHRNYPSVDEEESRQYYEEHRAGRPASYHRSKSDSKMSASPRFTAPYYRYEDDDDSAGEITGKSPLFTKGVFRPTSRTERDGEYWRKRKYEEDFDGEDPRGLEASPDPSRRGAARWASSPPSSYHSSSGTPTTTLVSAAAGHRHYYESRHYSSMSDYPGYAEERQENHHQHPRRLAHHYHHGYHRRVQKEGEMMMSSHHYTSGGHPHAGQPREFVSPLTARSHSGSRYYRHGGSPGEGEKENLFRPTPQKVHYNASSPVRSHRHHHHHHHHSYTRDAMYESEMGFEHCTPLRRGPAGSGSGGLSAEFGSPQEVGRGVMYATPIVRRSHHNHRPAHEYGDPSPRGKPVVGHMGVENGYYGGGYDHSEDYAKESLNEEMEHQHMKKHSTALKMNEVPVTTAESDGPKPRAKAPKPPRRKKMYSDFVGVTYNKTHAKFQACITHYRKQHYLGRYRLAVDAARAYDESARLLKGAGWKINFGSQEEYERAKKRELAEIEEKQKAARLAKEAKEKKIMEEVEEDEKDSETDEIEGRQSPENEEESEKEDEKKFDGVQEGGEGSVLAANQTMQEVNQHYMGSGKTHSEGEGPENEPRESRMASPQPCSSKDAADESRDPSSPLSCRSSPVRDESSEQFPPDVPPAVDGTSTTGEEATPRSDDKRARESVVITPTDGSSPVSGEKERKRRRVSSTSSDTEGKEPADMPSAHGDEPSSSSVKANDASELTTTSTNNVDEVKQNNENVPKTCAAAKKEANKEKATISGNTSSKATTGGVMQNGTLAAASALMTLVGR